MWAPPTDLANRVEEVLPPDWVLRAVDAPVSSRGDGGSVSPQAIDAARGAEVYVGAGVPRDVFIAAQPELRWAHSTTAGISSFLYPELLRSSVVFTNSAGIHAAPMAETALGMILHFARGFDFAAAGQQRGEWEQSHFIEAESPVREIAGAELVLLGLGGIGREVQQRAVALGMKVSALRSQHTRPELESALRRVDYLVIAAPDTPKTRGLIGPAELALLPRTAVVINIARGSIVDEAALTSALAERRLRGAGLDVFAAEPLPADSPLWRLPNVLITPHVSAVTRKYWDRQLALILENLAAYLSGAPLRNVVDKARGY
jgi:phosphoglycerate dehydrogenase-like enzyme